jgi:ribosomal-protein-alanine N-acetyltransferase
MPSTSCFVSTLHEDPIGFLLFSCSGVEAEIIMICTIPEQREKGAANKLANALFEHLHLKNVRDVFLEVNPDNTPALKLYHKLGFEQVGRRKNYYKSAEGFSTDALVMKRIPPNFGGF